MKGQPWPVIALLLFTWLLNSQLSVINQHYDFGFSRDKHWLSLSHSLLERPYPFYSIKSHTSLASLLNVVIPVDMQLNPIETWNHIPIKPTWDIVLIYLLYKSIHTLLGYLVKVRKVVDFRKAVVDVRVEEAENRGNERDYACIVLSSVRMHNTLIEENRAHNEKRKCESIDYFHWQCNVSHVKLPFFWISLFHYLGKLLNSYLEFISRDYSS